MKNGDTWVNYQYFNPNPTVALIPTMTSNTTPSGEASASSIHSAPKDAYTAFDGNDETAWACATTGPNQQGPSPNWVMYDFGHDVLVKRVTIKGFMSGSNYSSRTFTLQGYDGITWNDMNVSITITSTATASVDADLSDNTNAYSKYRLYCSTYIGVGSQWNAQIAMLQLYGYDNV